MQTKIEHVIVLMMENRSFDHVLGWLNQQRPEIDGPSADYKNAVLVGSPLAARYPASPTADWLTELPFDPPHEFADVSEHVFGTASPQTGQAASMDGFVARAARENAEKNAQGNPGAVMEGFAPGALPAIHALANEFAICQRWFASVPGPTWPNRFFAHCGSAGGWLDGALRFYDMPSVFSRLSEANKSAHVYFHDAPHTALLTDLSLRQPWLLHSFSAFLSHAAKGMLPAYSFIEPNYISTGGVSGANDQHPTAAMQPGDALIAQVYEAVRASPLWEKSLLLVVWDEHGGFYDHVPPGPAIPPFDNVVGQYGFGFDRLGVRVPAVVVSPWIPKGVVDNTEYEHASIPATLSELFGVPPLTRRDANAASFLRLCTLDAPRADTPETLPSVATGAAVPAADVEDIDPGPTVGARRRAVTRSDARKPPRSPTKHEEGFREVEEKVARQLGITIPPGKHLGDVIDSVRSTAGLEAKVAQKKAEKSRRKRPVLADKIDLRDRLYTPRVASAPPLSLVPPKHLPAPRDQEDTSACTGYALALLVDYLLARAERPAPKNVSPRMLYSMARRYDEFPGSKKDEGSSLRGALKGWFRHGVCRHELWPDKIAIEAMPKPSVNAKEDWWSDALLCPLGAYYRIEVKAILDLQAALVEVGAVYVSAIVHANWDDVTSSDDGAIPTIPFRKATRDDGGHAFVLVGYDDEGFFVQNSWGKAWGKDGIARLTYEDWLAHAMDAWVVQLGVPTREREDASKHAVLGAKSSVAATPIVRDHQLAPYIVDAERGRLSRTGRFRTTVDDLAQLTGPFLRAFEREHGNPGVVDVALYAHGGVVDEDTAAASAGRWIPKLLARGVFPIFVMWESDVVSTAQSIVADALGVPAAGARAGVAGALRAWLDRRIERASAPIGTRLWSEMKASAAALTNDERGALRILFGGTSLVPGLDPKKIRLHLIGHSAGSIVHATLAAWLVGRGFSIASMTLLAPAIRVDAFERMLLPHLGREIERLRLFCLDDASETSDPTIPIYEKSILCLLSHAFEGGANVPILGMERFAKPLAGHPAVEIVVAPGRESRAHTHIGFDDDATTIDDVIGAIAPAKATDAVG